MPKIPTFIELAIQFEAASKIYEETQHGLANSNASFKDCLTVLGSTHNSVIKVICALKMNGMAKTEEQQIQFERALKSSGVSFVKPRKPKSKEPPPGGGIFLRLKLANLQKSAIVKEGNL